MKRGSAEKFHSLPNVRTNTSEIDVRRMYSLSLSQLRKHTEFSDYQFKPSPFNIRWVYGFNRKVDVINLNDRGSTQVFYAASNCGIIYNWTTNQMRILQGHKHMITCIAADAQGRWLVTADSGSENIIIIWDASDYFPQKTIFSPHGNTKLSRLALSADAKYLLTLAYKDKTILYWWIWSFGKDEPHSTLEVELPKDSVIAMEFNPYNTLQFLLLTKHDIWIGVAAKIFVKERGVLKETDNYELKLRKPEKKLHSDFGRLTCFTFVKNTSQILVGTSRGGVLVYGYTIEYQLNADSSKFENLRYVKVLKIDKCRINNIQSVDDVIVTGNSAGEIHFYDDQMKLVYWVHGFLVDSVKRLTFNISPRSFKILDPKCNKICLCWETVVVETDPETGNVTQKLLKKKIPTDATTGGKPFLVRDFIVCTNEQGLGFVDFVPEKLVTILDYKTSPVLSLSVHPEKLFVSLGYTDGTVELINFTTHKLFTRLDLRNHYKTVIPPKDDSIRCNYEITFPQLSVTCLKYSPSGLHLACGLNTGQLLFLDPTTLDILTPTPFKDTKHAIKEMNYSEDSLTLAFSDEGKTVCVYKYCCDNFVWKFIGKHRAHYRTVHSVFFSPRKNENGDYKLISIGADRIMVEYDIGQSSDEYLEILSLDRIDQSATPLAGIIWPTPKEVNPEECNMDLPLILLANDEYKYKILNYNSTMTLATVLGPRFENPVSKIELVTRKKEKEESTYLLFATKNVIGIQKLPLDGNPWKHVGMLGHPNQITVMCYREDSETLFTIGTKDNCMCQWAANYRSVDTTTNLGGGDLDPYYCLIENGRPGWLFQEIRDLFYYIQILCQGTFSPAMRRVKDVIPINSLPDLMRALGFFPSEYEVENLLVEAKFKVYQKQMSKEIDFEEFVKLYLNHRPAFGENFKRIKNAYKNFAYFEKDELVMERHEFIAMLSDYGEFFSRDLSWYLLSILSGHSFEDRAMMPENDFSFLPMDIKFNELATNIMGIRESDTISDQQSAVDSATSQHTGSTLESDDRIIF